jgi:PII-like signaling protein
MVLKCLKGLFYKDSIYSKSSRNERFYRKRDRTLIIMIELIDTDLKINRFKQQISVNHKDHDNLRSIKILIYCC